MQSWGKYLIIFGAIILAAGLLIQFFPKLNFFGRMPGDIVYKKDGFSFYFPIVTSIILSLLLTFIFWLINFFSRR
ncbi:MAG: DUF2905 domain-containing protein [Ignavibacteriae bacterium]|nr:MAG: DUF2905 domain-containing protein [Ignavibacteriota bacterium]